eukprot:GHVT01072905.1.p1 GENE.GHVT01072905.1~~GHVT01072905.1.p1  ORF type:complete len:233 (+),score=17.64 GHVT01072905.1:1436-2134(+)
MTIVSFFRDAVPALPWQATESEPTGRFREPKRKTISFASLAIPVVLVAAVSAVVLTQLKIAPNPVPPNEVKAIHVAPAVVPVGCGAHLPPPRTETSLEVSTRRDEAESEITAGRQALTRIRDNFDKCHSEFHFPNRSSTLKSRRLHAVLMRKFLRGCAIVNIVFSLAIIIVSGYGFASLAMKTNPNDLDNAGLERCQFVLKYSLGFLVSGTVAFVWAQSQEKDNNEPDEIHV